MCAKGCCVISVFARHGLGMNRRGFNSQTMSLFTNMKKEMDSVKILSPISCFCLFYKLRII